MSLLEAEVSLIRNKWQKHPIVTGLEAPCICGIDYLIRGYCKDPKRYWRVFGVATADAEKMKQLSVLLGFSEYSVVGLLHVKEQQVLIAATKVHWQ